ncbi:MAG: radical SAM protein [Eubacterium sp.]|nr:radical SAM protein [Eubacterium sp.]
MARRCVKEGNDLTVSPEGYGLLTALALDPIEKKPLYHFYPGSFIVSAGGYGCNLKCPFCQNHEISLSEYSGSLPSGISGMASARGTENTPSGDISFDMPDVRYYSPEELTLICAKYRKAGNIGIAFTYNEPTIIPEYIVDTARLIRSEGMKTVLVTNGSASDETLDKILPWIDAMNIDLKSFDREYYKKVLHGDLDTVLNFITRSARSCHVEVTTLIIPGENDSDEEMMSIASWLAQTGKKSGRDIPFHISRFFPRSVYSKRKPTDTGRIYELSDIARKYLRFVHEGNV